LWMVRKIHRRARRARRGVTGGSGDRACEDGSGASRGALAGPERVIRFPAQPPARRGFADARQKPTYLSACGSGRQRPDRAEGTTRENLQEPHAPVSGAPRGGRMRQNVQEPHTPVGAWAWGGGRSARSTAEYAEGSGDGVWDGGRMLMALRAKRHRRWCHAVRGWGVAGLRGAPSLRSSPVLSSRGGCARGKILIRGQHPMHREDGGVVGGASSARDCCGPLGLAMTLPGPGALQNGYEPHAPVRRVHPF
jgi:hypothetical protein